MLPASLPLALIYPEAERGQGKIDPARKGAESASFSYRRLQEARQIIRHADLVDQVKSAPGSAGHTPRA